MYHNIPTDATGSIAACALYDNLFPTSNCLYEHVDKFSLWLQGNRCQVSADGISSKNGMNVAELHIGNSLSIEKILF